MTVAWALGALVAGRLGSAPSRKMRLRIASGRWAWRGFRSVLWRRSVTRNVHPRHAVSDPGTGRFASASEGVLRPRAGESVGLTPRQALEFTKRSSSAFDQQRATSVNPFDVADGGTFLVNRCAERIAGGREKWDRELFKKKRARHRWHEFASTDERTPSAIEQAAGDTCVHFRFDPLFNNLPELLAQIRCLVHAREFK